MAATQERGIYQPQEDFTSYEDYPEEEGRSRLPLMIVIALVVVAAFAGVVWLAYNQGVAHGRAGAPPIVAAPAGPVRTPPDETQTASGGASTPYTGLKVYGEPIPPDEEAQDSALAPSSSPDVTVATQQALPAQDDVVATPEQPSRSMMPEVETTPAPPPAPAATATHPQPTAIAHNAPPPAAAPDIAVTHPAPPPAAAHQHSPVDITSQTSAALAPAPAAPGPSAASAVSEPPPVQVASTTPTETHTGGSAITGGAVLQIGSYTSMTLASGGWRSFHAKHATQLDGLSSDIATVQIPGKGTWYRLRIGPFADRAAAAAKCAQLKAQGATCIVASP